MQRGIVRRPGFTTAPELFLLNFPPKPPITVGIVPPLTATQTIDRARAALKSGLGAGLPELLKLIETLTTNHAEINLEQLAELIEKDPAVLSRVLSVANTVGQNPSFLPMSSVMHAIHQIGFTRVRNLALSLMLIENAGPRNATEQREAAAHALCAGLLAQGCAACMGSVDPDLAFACAALRQFGHILLPAVSLDHYQESVELMKTKSPDLSFRATFGLTPLELSRQLLAPSRLPEEITRSLRDCKPETIAGTAASTYDSRLLGVADFGGQLASIMLDSKTGPDAFLDRTRALARRYEKIVPGAQETIVSALQHADDRIASFTQSNGASALPTASLRRIKDRVRGQAPGTATANSEAAEQAAAANKAAGIHEDPVNSTEDLSNASPATELDAPAPAPLPDAIEAVALALGPATQLPLPPTADSSAAIIAASIMPVAPTLPTHPIATPAAPVEPEPKGETVISAAAATAELWTPALKLVLDSFGAQECWLFSPQPGGESMPLVHGIGPHWLFFQTQAVLRLDERTVFGVCLTRRENVVIHDTTAASLVPYLPPWFRNTAGAPGAFLLMPLHDKKIAHGLVLIGWSKTQRIDVSAAQTELARQIFASVSLRHRAKVI